MSQPCRTCGRAPGHLLGCPECPKLEVVPSDPACPDCGQCRGVTGGCDDDAWHPDWTIVCMAPYDVVCHLHG